MKAKEYFVVHIYGDVEPQEPEGFDTNEDRVGRARAIRDENPDDGIYKIDIDWEKRTISVDSFHGDDCLDDN